MKFATYLEPGASTPVVGVVEDGLLHPLTQVADMRDLVDGGLARALELGTSARRRPGRRLDEVRLLAPLAPASIRDFVAFEEHVEGVRRSIDGATGVPEAWYDAPTFYFTNPHAILGPDDEVAYPSTSVARDVELEVAVVVTGTARSVSAEQAAQHIFGYTILNDFSARDLQSREMQVSLGPAKGKDFATALGPWIVTADELAPFKDADGFLDLGCRILVNGTEIGRDLLSNMGWTFETMIAYASRDTLVRSGDVLASGTTGNGGCLAELWGLAGAQEPKPLQDGDVVTIEVEHLGRITNTVGSAPPAPPLPPHRRATRRRPTF